QTYYAPPIIHPVEIEKQQEMAKGVRLSIIGGGIVALNFFSFIFSPFRGGSPLGFWTYVGFILLAVGISKIVASRPLGGATTHGVSTAAPQAQYDVNPGPPIRQTSSPISPHPVFSAPAPGEHPAAPQTGELGPVPQPSISVTEDDTKHLPHSRQPSELSR